jgi:hypothetical protein
MVGFPVFPQFSAGGYQLKLAVFVISQQPAYFRKKCGVCVASGFVGTGLLHQTPMLPIKVIFWWAAQPIGDVQ